MSHWSILTYYSLQKTVNSYTHVASLWTLKHDSQWIHMILLHLMVRMYWFDRSLLARLHMATVTLLYINVTAQWLNYDTIDHLMSLCIGNDGSQPEVAHNHVKCRDNTSSSMCSKVLPLSLMLESDTLDTRQILFNTVIEKGSVYLLYIEYNILDYDMF